MKDVEKFNKFVIAICLILPSSFMIADGVLMMLGSKAIFFQGLDSRFEFIVGVALIILGGSRLDSKRKN